MAHYAAAAKREGSAIREDSDLFGVYVDGQLVGCGGVRPGRKRGVLILSGAYIEPEHRRQGLATKLIARREQHARDRGAVEIRSVVLNVWLDSWLHRGYTIRRRFKIGAEVSLDIARPRPPVQLSFAVLAHPARRERGAALAEALGARLIVDEEEGPPQTWRAGRYAWLAHSDGATHHVVLEDDAVPCDGFLDLAQAAVEARPDYAAITFYANRKEIDEARAAGLPWARIPTSSWRNTQAVCLPVGWARALVAHGDKPEVMEAGRRWVVAGPSCEHALISLLRRISVKQIWATAPSLVEHGEPSASLLGHNHPDRVARWYEQTPGPIDFTRGVT